MTEASDSSELRAPAEELLKGKHSVRWHDERRWFWLTLLLAPITAGLVGFLVRQEIDPEQLGLLLVVVMVYVSLVRGRLLGTSIRVHEGQLPELFAIVRKCARTLGVPVPHIFVREDYYVPITALGLGAPYSLVISSTWLPHLEEDELTFLVARELGHIFAGHTRFDSLFSPSGKENAVVGLIFGAWLRRTEFSCDRVALLCGGSLDAAARAIFVSTFHSFARRADLAAFAAQRKELERDPALKMGEWIGQTPYATERIAELERFAASPLYDYWRPRLVAFEASGGAAVSAAASRSAARPAFAGYWQRIGVIALDAIVVGNLVKLKFSAQEAGVSNVDLKTLETLALTKVLPGHLVTLLASGALGAIIFALALYGFILVALTGRTFGMMVLGLRVVRKDSQRASPARSFWRYVLALLSTLMVLPLFLTWGRITIYDRLSGTRVIQGSE